MKKRVSRTRPSYFDVGGMVAMALVSSLPSVGFTDVGLV